MTLRLLEPWHPATPPRDPAALQGYLGHALGDLARRLEAMRLMVQYGPVPGAYLPWKLGGFRSGGLPNGTTIDLFKAPAAFRPIAFSVWVENAASTLSVRLRYNAGAGNVEILSSQPFQFTGSALLNAATDFAVTEIPAGADCWLFVDTVGIGGTAVPSHIQTVLLGKFAGKADGA